MDRDYQSILLLVVIKKMFVTEINPFHFISINWHDNEEEEEELNTHQSFHSVGVGVGVAKSFCVEPVLSCL